MKVEVCLLVASLGIKDVPIQHVMNNPAIPQKIFLTVTVRRPRSALISACIAVCIGAMQFQRYNNVSTWLRVYSLRHPIIVAHEAQYVWDQHRVSAQKSGWGK